MKVDFPAPFGPSGPKMEPRGNGQVDALQRLLGRRPLRGGIGLGHPGRFDSQGAGGEGAGGADDVSSARQTTFWQRRSGHIDGQRRQTSQVRRIPPGRQPVRSN